MSHNKTESEASTKEIVKYINAISGPLTIVDLEQVTKLLAAFAESRERAGMERKDGWATENESRLAAALYPDPKSSQPMLGTCNKWKVLHEKGDHLTCSDWEPLLPPATTAQLTRWEADFTKEPYMRVSENGEWVRFADLQTEVE